jgi:heat induced stress protein YflT
MAGKNISVFGIYASREMAENAVDRLLAEGFRNEDISVLLQDNVGSKDFAHEKHTKAPEGTATGVVAGGIIGGTIGLLAGIGVLAIPGLGPLIAAGPIIAALSGIGSGGMVGGIIGSLVGLGIPEYEAKRYEGRIKEGGILLSVHCDNATWIGKAKQLLRDTGAEDIASAGEEPADFQKTPKTLTRSAIA